MVFGLRIIAVAWLLILSTSWISPAFPAGAAVALPSLAPMIKVVSPAVVNIATRGTLTEHIPRNNPLFDDPFFRRFFNVPNEPTVRHRKFQSAGSGVIVDARKGYIVTNRHVIENASEITVTLLDNRRVTATVVGSDEGTDIAVLKVQEPRLSEMPLGDSSHLEVGDWVVAIGNPFGLAHTVTVGIVSALGRTGINPRGYEDFIQTDASINPGNSGGALVNVQGELVGINSAILSGENGGNIGIGFAIPVNMVKAVMQQLITYGAVKRGALGIKLGGCELRAGGVAWARQFARRTGHRSGARLARRTRRHHGRRHRRVDQRHGARERGAIAQCRGVAARGSVGRAARLAQGSRPRDGGVDHRTGH